MATQIITAINIVADIGEAVLTHVSLHMSNDVGITTASEGVEDTAIVQVNIRITGYQAFESTTVEILTLGHVRTIALGTLCNTRETGIAIQVDIGAVILIVFVPESPRCGSIMCICLTNSTLFTTTEDLEGVALVQVDGRTAPDLRVATIATTEYIQGRDKAVGTLLRKDHACISLRDGIIIRLFLCSICIIVVDVVISFLVSDIKEFVTLMDGGIQVDDHVTFHVTIAIAATIDITAFETTVKVSGIALARSRRDGRNLFSCSSTDGVPLQTLRLVSLIYPAHRLYLQTFKIQDELIAVGIRSAQNTT